jgi:hypothetical protein
LAWPATAERACRGGEEHEFGEVEVFGEPVQVPGGVGLGAEHGLETLRCQRGDDAVVEDACGVDDAGERVLCGDGCQ